MPALERVKEVPPGRRRWSVVRRPEHLHAPLLLSFRQCAGRRAGAHGAVLTRVLDGLGLPNAPFVVLEGRKTLVGQADQLTDAADEGRPLRGLEAGSLRRVGVEMLTEVVQQAGEAILEVRHGQGAEIAPHLPELGFPASWHACGCAFLSYGRTARVRPNPGRN
jgi:hypothetical protein